MTVILVVGGCGVGKTWVMEQLVKKLKLDTLGSIGMFAFHRNDKVTVLGKYDGSTFQGSDKLSMAVMRDLDLFYKNCKTKFVVCEGDRFTNSTFIEGVKPIIIKIVGDGAAGRAKRGSSQSERQIKSIATRVAKVNAEISVESSTRALKEILCLIA